MAFVDFVFVICERDGTPDLRVSRFDIHLIAFLTPRHSIKTKRGTTNDQFCV